MLMFTRMIAEQEHEHEDEQEDHHWCPTLDRRSALQLLGLSTLGTLQDAGAAAA